MMFLAVVMDPRLQEMQVGVAAVRADEVVVRAVFHDASALDRDDAVGAAHRREAMGDDEDRAPLRNAPHVVLDDPLALVIERARRLVEDQDARIGDEGARDGDALALAAGEIAAALADDRVVAFRQLQDEVVRAGERPPP